MGDTREQDGQGGGRFAGGLGGGHFRPHYGNKFMGGREPFNNGPGGYLSGPTPINGPQMPHGDPRLIGPNAPPAGPQSQNQFTPGAGGMFGQGANRFMWGGGQAPVLNAMGNPANSQFMGMLGGKKWFNPPDTTY
jgi:hypothetical protein